MRKTREYLRYKS